MIHRESNGSFILVSGDERIDVDLDMEHTPIGCCAISAGNVVSQVTLSASEMRELIVELTKVAEILEHQQ